LGKQQFGFEKSALEQVANSLASWWPGDGATRTTLLEDMNQCTGEKT
jgi:hypothetical protein